MKCEVCGKEIEQSSYSNAILCSAKCFEKYYWAERLRNKDSERQVVIEGRMYQIGNEDEPLGCFRGFDGAKFYIDFNDGRKIVTTNLWCNGDIPEEYKKGFPDNAKWAPRDINPDDYSVIVGHKSKGDLQW